MQANSFKQAVYMLVTHCSLCLFFSAGVKVIIVMRDKLTNGIFQQKHTLVLSAWSISVRDVTDSQRLFLVALALNFLLSGYCAMVTSRLVDLTNLYVLHVS
jgi:hypothetical protein